MKHSVLGLVAIPMIFAFIALSGLNKAMAQQPSPTEKVPPAVELPVDISIDIVTGNEGIPHSTDFTIDIINKESENEIHLILPGPGPRSPGEPPVIMTKPDPLPPVETPPSVDIPPTPPVAPPPPVDAPPIDTPPSPPVEEPPPVETPPSVEAPPVDQPPDQPVAPPPPVDAPPQKPY